MYRQSAQILQMLLHRALNDSDRQRDLSQALYKLGTTMARIGGEGNLAEADVVLRKGLNLAKLYSGGDREKFIDDL